MTESLINEWLADCGDVSSSELHTFATTLSQDNEIVRALYALLEERSKYSQLVDTVCTQLFDFYRSQEIELRRFTLQFLPTLIYICLNSAAHGDIKNCRSVETLLIGLYNLEVVDKSGQQKAISFRLPSLAMLSIYHEPASLAPASLTESAVRRFEECNTKLVSWGPLHQVETLNAQNRLKVMTALLFVYNQQLGYINKFALEQLCKVATKLVTQGFTKQGHHQRSSYGSESSFVPRLLPRIPVCAQFLLEFLNALYFAMYNDCWYLATQAMEDIHNRACYEMYTDVMLVTNALRNIANSGPSGQSNDGSIGICTTTTTATISKSMITNASFRTKKLPDDIPIQVVKEDSTGDGKANLVSITEEQESTESNRPGSMRQIKVDKEQKDQKATSKITNFPVLGKKPKEKEGKVTKNPHTAASEKEKRLGLQATSKENIKGSSPMLNSEQTDVDGNVNGCMIRKKNNSIENNSIAESVAFIDGERLQLSEETSENTALETPIHSLRAHGDTEQLTSSIQVSSV